MSISSVIFSVSVSLTDVNNDCQILMNPPYPIHIEKIEKRRFGNEYEE